MQKKVAVLNLELGHPTVEAALQKMKNDLSTLKRQGVKAVVLIHGWGSSGVGGSIRPAVRKSLADSSMRGLIRDISAGEEWSAKKKEFIGICNALREEERQINGNPGVTVVLLR